MTTHVHAWVCHRYPLDAAVVKLRQWYLRIQRYRVQVHGQVDDVGLVHRWRRRGWLSLREAWGQVATIVLYGLGTQFLPLIISFNRVLALTR